MLAERVIMYITTVITVHIKGQVAFKCGPLDKRVKYL